MKQDIQNDLKLIYTDADQMQVFVTINNIRVMINADVNVKYCLIKEDVMKDLFAILVIVSENVINHVVLDDIQITKIVNAEKNQLKNVVKILMEMK